MSDDVFELVGTSIHGKYRVDGVVGEGGFGVVYRGFHLSFEQPIAIKCLKMPSHFTAEARQTFLERFREEGKLLAKLASHGSVTRVYDFAVAPRPDGTAVPYLVLEWLDGHELTELIAERGPIGEQEALTLLRPAVDALAFAHEMGIAHRDIKPDNLFLTEGHRGRQLKVLDFGIAKVMQEGDRITQLATKTSSGFRAFTPAYASPEQINSATFGATGPWTDVHAVGLIATELVVGRRALDADGAAELYLQVTGETRPTPHSKGVHASDAFEELCRRALARNPRERFPDASALLEAMDATLAQLEGDAAANVGQVFAAAHQSAESSAIAAAATAFPDEMAPIDRPATPAQALDAPAMTLMDEPAPPHVAAPAAPIAAPTAPRYGAYAPPAAESPPPEPTRWGCWVAIGLSILALPVTTLVLFSDEIAAMIDPSEIDEPEDDDELEELPVEAPRGASSGACDDFPSCEAGCERNHGNDCVRLADMLIGGQNGAPLNKERAFQYYYRACDEDGDGDACTKAGIMLLYGEGGKFPRDPKHGIAILKKGCREGDPEGCARLGKAYEDGVGVDADAATAHGYYHRSCFELGHAIGCVDGAKLSRRSGERGVEEDYRREACRLGRTDQCDGSVEGGF